MRVRWALEEVGPWPAAAASRVRQVLRAVRSVFSEEKKLSMAELSQTFPDRLMEQVMP
jgi:hypothetical protein